ncbi:MAG TPA: phosphoribosylanthranilate isomerase [Oscillospiraceae bacterium]|nr:phosphoribosylanthranilate isomerase [Oscillospiraceae bacterium]HPF56445.1 phosphoribosylanthranilate isomerase [Clostridiales bacterium]HPK35636.1 phosphoribosylanthranilate isomerase [Oscillospiraceae bacterium]HPR74699.1 phosphoribosylanthranilate isomerase [Oscillospiraceae bacterium]
MNEVKIKICGLFREQDIEYANALKPDYIGFVFAKSHRQVTPGQAKKLRQKLAPGMIPVGVFVDEPVEHVAKLLSDGVIEMAQLHGHEDEKYITELRKLSGKRIIQAFRITENRDEERAVLSTADDILLDGGSGSGVQFDWTLIQEVKRPFFLAGGLNPENVSEAIRVVKPFAVDASSGVETGKVKDFEKMRRFIEAVRGV